jgi:spore coat polysaccharide biosynthesis predicted glycosyltransferase SpsG
VTIVIAADAAPEAGLGHLSRSSALAGALRAQGAAVSCLALGAQDPLSRDGIDWMPAPEVALGERVRDGQKFVLDSYRTQPETVAALAGRTRLVFFDDHGELVPGTILTISTVYGHTGPGVLAGVEFACLGRAFWSVPARAPRERVARVLVATGGTDPGGIGATVAGSLASHFDAVALVRGPSAGRAVPQGVRAVVDVDCLAGELLQADLVVTAAGLTLREACAVGTPAVALPVADNQRAGAAWLAAQGAALVVDPPMAGAAVTAALDLAADAPARRALSGRGRQLVDGRGAHRVAARILELT